MSELTRTQAVQTLTAAEQDELESLLAEYDRSVLRRAQAFALLSLRGHMLPDLNEKEQLIARMYGPEVGDRQDVKGTYPLNYSG